ASGADIKKRYFELVRIYHPDTAQSQGITVEQAEARFHAITQAYNALLQLDPDYRARSSDGTSLDKEAEEIKERLAKWSRMGQSSQDRARRQRAMDAEASAGKWWKSDLSIVYLLGAVGAQFRHRKKG
ncbi:10755_t:CDS:2, partial [Acaulospora colombiana]